MVIFSYIVTLGYFQYLFIYRRIIFAEYQGEVFTSTQSAMFIFPAYSPTCDMTGWEVEKLL